MATARDIITKALQKIGAVTKTESVSADEASDGLSSLNGLISSWANDSLLVHGRSWETFTLTAGDGEYTIGPTADFPTTRPVSLVASYVRDADTDYPLQVISDESYTLFIQSKSDSGVPDVINLDNAYPTSKIRLYPVPDRTYTLFLLSEKPLTTLGLDDTISLPPGWERALIYNLAIEIAPEYGQQIDQVMYQIALEAKASIKRAVARSRPLDVNISSGTFNIYTGY